MTVAWAVAGEVHVRCVCVCVCVCVCQCTCGLGAEGTTRPNVVAEG